jgi:hypothetical protein
MSLLVLTVCAGFHLIPERWQDESNRKLFLEVFGLLRDDCWEEF